MTKQKSKPLLIIEKFGYQYFLVESERNAGTGIVQPNFMNMPNMALKSCKKINKKDKK